MDTLNLQTLQDHARRGVFNLISALSAISPILLVCAMLALFAALGFFQYLHFSDTMNVPFMALAAAALYQIIRFGTALASIRLFAAQAYFKGFLSLGASFVLTQLEYGMVTQTAAAVSTTAPGAVEVNGWLIGVFVWLSFALEIFVSTTLNAMFAERVPAAKYTNGTAHASNGTASNGTIKNVLGQHA